MKNDEIKEILWIIKSCKQDYDKQKEGMHTFDYAELYLLYNYITNLQQENEYLKMNNPEQNIEHFRVIKENKRKINNLREENKNQAKRNSRQRLANQKQQELILNLQQENKTLQENNQAMQEEMARVWKENERLKEENIEIRQCLLIKRRSIPHKLTMDKSIEEILDMPTYEDYKSRCEKASETIDNMISNGWILEQAGTVMGYSPAKKCCKVRLERIKKILQNGSDEDE